MAIQKISCFYFGGGFLCESWLEENMFIIIFYVQMLFLFRIKSICFLALFQTVEILELEACV